MSSLQKIKVQMLLNEKSDKRVFDLVSKLEKESNGEKGYVNNEIKRILEVYQTLAEAVGEDDPLRLLQRLLTNVKEHGIKNELKEEKEEEVKQEKKPADLDFAMGLIQNTNNMK